MAKAKCVVCEQTRGKRGCKLHNMKLICPRCCAKIRHLECEGCSYYSQAEHFALEKMRKTGKPVSTPQFTARIDPDVDEAVDEALELAHKGIFKQARIQMQALLSENADIYTVHFGMGVIHALQDEIDLALPYFNRSVELFPYFSEGWVNKAMCHKERLEIGETLKALKRVTDYGDPKEQHVQWAKEHLHQIEQVGQTQQVTIQAIIDAEEIFNKAFEQMNNGEYEQAIKGFQGAIHINPGVPSAYGNMALCYAFLGYKQKALNAFEKALECDAGYKLAIENRAIVEKMKEGEKLSGTTLMAINSLRDM